jgi:hypothetical protein
MKKVLQMGVEDFTAMGLFGWIGFSLLKRVRNMELLSKIAQSGR